MDYNNDITDEEFNMVMSVFDANGDGVISFDEFISPSLIRQTSSVSSTS